MKWENLVLFRQMDIIINSLEKKGNENSDCECNHEYQSIEGAKTCIKCGIVEYYEFDNNYDYEYHQRHSKTFRPYEREIHLKNLARRISGYKFLDGKGELKKEEIPETLTQIRKVLKLNKMNIKNDFYYYRIKHDIDSHINKNDLCNWVSEYKKLNNISPKNFLYKKMSKKIEYQEMCKMIEIKKNIQTDLKK